jgi:hypothetical protein
MSRLFARPFPGVSSGVAAVVLLNTLPLHASFLPQDRSLADLDDPLIRSEILELGGYQELVLEFITPTLVEVPLFSHSPGHLEFRNDDLRVRIEAQPFEHPEWVKKSNGAWMLEGQRVLGWSPAEAHSRLSRSEVVIDGCVVDLPTESWVDVFDAPLRREDLLFASAMRSKDGRRVYVHVQAGDADARMVTWVLEDGAFLYRLVDPLP